MSKAEANFPELAIIGVRLGRLRDENTKCFNGENMRQYLSQKLLKPSASTFYLQIKAKEREEKAKLGKRTTPILPPNTADNLDDDDDSSSDDDDRAHSDAAFEQLSTMVTNIKPTNLKKLEKIGEGGEAVVYKGDWCGTIVALKETVLSSASFANAIKRQLVKEVHMHAELRHPNIITFFGISHTERSIMIVTELMDMSLDIVMFPTTEAPAPITLNEIEKLNISAEVTKGLMYLHGKRIVHADVKPPNILISKDLQNVKLCDIGLSRVKLSIRMSSTQSPKKGTVLYMSPAMLLDNARSSFSCDVWALGATMAELFSGLDMWRIPGDLNRLEKKLKSNMRSQTDPHALAALRGDTDGEEIYEVVKSCLEYSIPKRATPAKILEKLITIIEIKQVAVAQPEVEAQEGVVDKKESEVRGQAQEVQAAAQVREEERPTKQTVKDHVPSKHATRSKSAKRK